MSGLLSTLNNTTSSRRPVFPAPARDTGKITALTILSFNQAFYDRFAITWPHMGYAFLDEVLFDQVNQYAYRCIFGGLKIGLEFGNTVFIRIEGIAVNTLIMLPVKNGKAIT